MLLDEELLDLDGIALPPQTRYRRISPTDISQYIRLEQCQRYLSLQLRARDEGHQFMRDYGVVPQAIPPLLTRSGTTFEEKIESAIGRRFDHINFAQDPAYRVEGQRVSNNEHVLTAARSLRPGDVLCLFQVRLVVALQGWAVHGDLDILRMERNDTGLHLLIADMKSSAAVKVEHRLQVAFYQIMLEALLEEAGNPYSSLQIAILYKGEADIPAGLSQRELEALRAQREAASRYFGVEDALLELVSEPEAYLDAVNDLVLAPESIAHQTLALPFEEIPFHLTYKCDGCLYNQYCMKWSAQHDDLSMIPHLTLLEKEALRRAGITTAQELANLKEPGNPRNELVPAPGKEALVQTLAATWPVGPRLDELIHRARRYRRWKKDEIEALSYIPNKGHGSLPYCDEDHNPNLVRIYIDAQHDYLQDRIYLLGALVAGCEGGETVPHRRRSIVQLTDGPPDGTQKEEQLFVQWIHDVLQAVVELAAPDETGESNAPIHLIFYDRYSYDVLLDGLNRHLGAIFGATPLYDFMTQLAAFDSPIVTFLNEEIRELKNYPMVCQSLQQVAAYLRFDWDQDEHFREIFKERLFDFWGKFEEPEMRRNGETPWYTSRARFNSQIPLEYAYCAWGVAPRPQRGQRNLFRPYRDATVPLLKGFTRRRLEALEWIARDFKGNELTTKTPFRLPDLATFDEKARTLAHALHEFVTIERHVDFGRWKALRYLAPERRMLMGETLLARYCPEDQPPDVAEQNRENERRQLSPTDKWSQTGMRFRLRLETADLVGGLDEVLALTTLREGDSVVVYRRWAVDERLPPEEQFEFTPTTKQLLYGTRAEIVSITVERDHEGKARGGWVEIEMQEGIGGPWSRGFVFRGFARPFVEGALYTLDPDPNDWYGYWCAIVTEGLCGLEDGTTDGSNTLYDRLTNPSSSRVTWPAEAIAGQKRFLEGLQALHAAGAFHDFEPGKEEYIGSHGTTPVLLVQGPPGTGKSYSTAFALFARLQGAMAAGMDYRVVVSCKTHAATDVLIENVLHVQETLRDFAVTHPEIFKRFFDPRLLDIPLFRVAPKSAPPAGIEELIKDAAKERGEKPNARIIQAEPWCVVGATPGGIYGMVKKLSGKGIKFYHHFCDCLVLDEASQMNIPEAIMAALVLRDQGQIIVVGDHRQMPPIVKHDWESEPRRTFKEYKSYESLFATLLELDPPPPMIQFEESFRLHADMAEFLRREIYAKDGILYHSKRESVLPTCTLDDPFIAAVLAPEHPIVVVVHREAQSQTRNVFEQHLIAPVLEVLADSPCYALDPLDGIGVVVPHRAQRAEMQRALPMLAITDPDTGTIRQSAVDTVERFQGGERTVIVVGATESDREYLLASGGFLLDPRRLTVAISRAKRKMILVASQSVFTLFSPEEEIFLNAQLWKNLLRRTCTVKLWEGERGGVRVEVWGNA